MAVLDSLLEAERYKGRQTFGRYIEILNFENHAMTLVLTIEHLFLKKNGFSEEPPN